MTLDEYFEKTEARRHLVENLKNNMIAMGISPSLQKSLLRVNLIMIRQAMEDEGIE